MKKPQIRTLAQNWIACFKTHDLDRLLSLYAEDARHYSPRIEAARPQTAGWLAGKQEMREWWGNIFTTIPSLNYELRDLTLGGNRVFMEYLRQAKGEESREVMEYLRVEKDLITESRVLGNWPVRYAI